MDNFVDSVLNTFKSVFGGEGNIRTFFAPGRVNLIGEHTDYNGGYVLPCALAIGTYAAVRKREDTKLRFYSENFSSAGVVERDITETKPDKSKSFTDYPLSVVWALREQGYLVDTGFDIVFYGNIPYASGLSSSASVEVLTGFICNELFDLSLDNIEIAKIGQYAENRFIGVNCGIMDQFAIAMGKLGYAIYLNTSTLEYEYIPVRLNDCSLVIACTNKKRGLGESKYNERFEQCQRAAEKLKIKHLGELTREEFDKLSGCIGDSVIELRAKHAVYENIRTSDACAALIADDIRRFGELMNESHISLRDDYEVTGLELDTLVFAAWKQPGVIGSRMTGAGFGGCTVSIVENEYIPDFIKNVGRIYSENTDYVADFYIADIGEGVREL